MASQHGRTGKKLIAWVRFNFGVDDVNPSYCQTCKTSRKSQNKCDACPEPQLLPENEAAVDLYLAAQTQWRHDQGERTGLDYNALKITASMTGVKLTKNLFKKLQIIEKEILAVDYDKREKLINA